MSSKDSKRRSKSRASSRSCRTPAGYDSENSDTSASYFPSKPPLTRSKSVGSMKPKRFIWPDELHRDFITAVFDIGLKTADTRTLMAMFPDAGLEGGTPIQMKAMLQKMRNFRYQAKKFGGDERNSSGHFLEYPQRSSGSSNHSSNMRKKSLLMNDAANLHNDQDFDETYETPIVSDEMQHLISRLDDGAVRRSLELIMRSVQVQQNVQQSLNRFRENQRHLQSMMMQKVGELNIPISFANVEGAYQENESVTNSDPQFAPNGLEPFLMHRQNSSLSSNALPLQSTIGAQTWLQAPSNLENYAYRELQQGAHADESSNAIPAELQLKMEMKGHMDMHRQMLMRQHDQLQLHCSPSEHNVQQKDETEQENEILQTAEAPYETENCLPLMNTFAVCNNNSLLAGVGLNASVALSKEATSMLQGAANWRWDDDTLDEQLFNFLVEG